MKTSFHVYFNFIWSFILFRIHEKDTVTGLKLVIAIQMTLEHVLAQRYKQSTKLRQHT